VKKKTKKTLELPQRSICFSKKKIHFFEKRKWEILEISENFPINFAVFFFWEKSPNF
jgi:hypothetical protein